MSRVRYRVGEQSKGEGESEEAQRYDLNLLTIIRCRWTLITVGTSRNGRRETVLCLSSEALDFEDMPFIL